MYYNSFVNFGLSLFGTDTFDSTLQPPTVLSLLEMLANQSGTVKARDLAKSARTYIFDFKYPLSDNISKEDFEVAILNHYITRRIGFESFRLWQIALENKLLEIMPKYNLLFNSLECWEVFKSGSSTRTLDEVTSDTGSKTGTNTVEGSSSTNTSATGSNIGSSESTQNDTRTDKQVSDKWERLRTSDTPQTAISDIENSKYVSAYAYNTSNDTTSDNLSDTVTSSASSKDSTESKADSAQTSKQTGSVTESSSDSGTRKLTETIIKSVDNEAEVLLGFQNDFRNVMTMIYKDLDDLFYTIINY